MPEALRGHYCHARSARAREGNSYQSGKALSDRAGVWDDLAVQPCLLHSRCDQATSQSFAGPARPKFEAEEFPAAPPQAHFQPITSGIPTDDERIFERAAYVPEYPPRTSGIEPERRPKIVVPVSELDRRVREPPVPRVTNMRIGCENGKWRGTGDVG